VDHRAGLDRCGKSRPHRDSIPIASLYIAYAIPAPNNNNNNNSNNNNTNKLRYSIVTVECVGFLGHIRISFAPDSCSS